MRGICVLSRYIWMGLVTYMNGHVTYEWVMSHTNEQWHVWISHDTNEWVMTRMNESCVCERVMSHLGSRHGRLSGAVLVQYDWGNLRPIRMSHVAYERVMSHMNESCRIWMIHVTYEGVMSHMKKSCHIWMRHVTYEWVMSHLGSRHGRLSSTILGQRVGRIQKACRRYARHRSQGVELQCVAVCCSVLQCVAACCSVLQRAAACCSVLQRVAVCCSVL